VSQNGVNFGCIATQGLF